MNFRGYCRFKPESGEMLMWVDNVGKPSSGREYSPLASRRDCRPSLPESFQLASLVPAAKPAIKCVWDCIVPRKHSPAIHSCDFRVITPVAAEQSQGPYTSATIGAMVACVQFSK
jgi:hypothetical protein